MPKSTRAWATVCRTPRKRPDAEWLLGLYRKEPTTRLLALKRALSKERASACDHDTIAFCDSRIPLVLQVLKEREASDA